MPLLAMFLPFVIKASRTAQQGMSRIVLWLGEFTLKELTALYVNHNTGWKVTDVTRAFKSYQKAELGDISSSGRA